MKRNGGERPGAELPLAEAGDVFGRPRTNLAARCAGHAGTDQVRLEPAAVAAERKAQQGGQGMHEKPGPRMPSQPAAEIGQESVMPRDRAVEIEDRDPHRGGAQAASWRRTKCRMPPFSMYSHSFGVSTRTLTLKRVTFPERLVDCTVASRLPAVSPSKS